MPYLTQEEIDAVDSKYKLVYPEYIIDETEARLYRDQLRHFFTLSIRCSNSLLVDETTIYFDLNAGSLSYPPDVLRIIPGSTIVFETDNHLYRKIIGVSVPKIKRDNIYDAFRTLL